MAQAVYLDSNCISYLLGQSVLGGSTWTDKGTASLRTAVRRAISDDRITVCGSHFHLEEASRMSEEARQRILDFYWELVRWHVLLPTHELSIEEAAAGRSLRANEPFETFERRQSLRRLSRDSSKLNAMAIDVKSWVDRHIEDAASMKQKLETRLAAEVSGMKPDEVTRRWWSGGGVAMIADWVRDYISYSKDHLKLGADPASWPEPRQMQTAWAMTSYLMARVYMNVGLGRKIGPGDAHDAHHYASACYADVLVTEDTAFNKTIAEIPDQPLTVLTFGDFASQFGIAPH
jgi:hypothetical protein